MSSDVESNQEGIDPVTKVFGTVELLEHILLHCPAQAILTSQGVAPNWKATITGSQKLQKAIFRVSIEGRDVRPACMPWPIWRYNEAAVDADRLSTPLCEYHSERVIMNPFVRIIFRCWDAWLFQYDNTDASAIYNDPAQTSWKQMFLTQPPTKTVALRADRAHVDTWHVALERVKADIDGLGDPSFDYLYWLIQVDAAVDAELGRDGYDTKPLEVLNEAGVTLGDIVAALPEVLNKGKWVLEAVEWKPGMMHFDILVNCKEEQSSE